MENEILEPDNKNYDYAGKPSVGEKIEAKKPQPQPEKKTEEPKSAESHGPGIIVLQWLTYAFWGFTSIALSTLVYLTLTHYMIKEAEIGDAPTYSLAAVLVLLPLSVICDFFYSRHEPQKKTGAASVVMVIHAVLFALIGIGALVSVVFSIATLFVSLSDTENVTVAMYGSLVVAALFALLFIRTLLPKPVYRFRRWFILAMLIIVGIVCAFGIVGPTMEARATRNDRLIENNISDVVSGVSQYVNNHKSLPDSLENLSLNGNAKKIIDNDLVKYQKDIKPPKIVAPTTPAYYDDYETHYYQLCVTYKKAKTPTYDYPEIYKNADDGSAASSSSPNNDYDDGYQTYIDTYKHPAGEKCYKLMTTRYSVIPMSSAEGINDSASEKTQ